MPDTEPTLPEDGQPPVDIDYVIRAIATDIEAAAGQACALWNNSDECKSLGVFIGYALDPLMRLTVHPRDRKAEGTAPRMEMEIRYV